MELGRQVGAVTLLVRTGYGAQVAEDSVVKTDDIVDDLTHAARIIQGLVTRVREQPDHRQARQHRAGFLPFA